ncbi:MAG: alpha-glucosidase [Candidatus Thorarchaeota archaeon]|nr:alpha-glucosidase [Candidatus Thorarchaeota archaeon]
MSSSKIVVIGAGSLQFGLGTCGSIFNSKVLEGAHVGLHDISAGNLELARNACQTKIDHDNLNFTLEATTNREEALKGANFIVNSIEVGPRFYWWELDKKIPLKYGSTQVFGENGGPGGMFHSLRVLPPILDICEDINKICPDATLINFSNPMSRILLSIKRKFPNLKTVGLCHEIALAEHLLPKILKIPFNEMELWCGGLNHMGAVVKARHKETNEDLIPEILKKGVRFLGRWRWGISSRLIHPVDLTRHILENYGFLPYTNDSHYGEYIGWAKDLVNKRGIKNFYAYYRSSLRYSGWRIRSKIRRGKGHQLVKPDHERAIPIIEGILSDSNHHELSVNLPNDGIISNLPSDSVIECPATVNKSGVKGIPLGEYPEPLVDLLRDEVAVQDLVVKAILNKSREYAVQALEADSNFPRKDLIDPFLDEMIELQKDWVVLC